MLHLQQTWRYTCLPSTQKAEAGRESPRPPGLRSEFLTQNELSNQIIFMCNEQASECNRQVSEWAKYSQTLMLLSLSEAVLPMSLLELHCTLRRAIFACLPC